ncbi:MAG: helix-turn-helix transcriptional regulator [Chloroflexi bacterium]|nr:helix-turn-helix transcriptional regulator [Chloroflexota bacterium]OJW05562.1 MAG: hypothetical protein BGO39_02795 [Chloroflexi bacterium 54-19]
MENEQSTEPKTFIEWLQQKKEQFELDYDSELAERLGLYEETVNRLFSGKQNPSASNVQTIIEKLKLREGSAEYNLLLKLAHEARYKSERAWRRPNRKSN